MSLKALSLLGFKEKDLYFISFEKYISQNSEIKLLDKKIQKYKYEKHEENRKKFIEEAKKLRKELKMKQKLNLQKSYSSSYILTQGEKILKNEKIRLNFSKKQQINELLNTIERQYKQEELIKKLEFQDKISAQKEKEESIRRNKEKKEYELRDKLQALKMERRAKNIRDNLIKKQIEREEEEEKLKIKLEMKKKEEEKERKERLLDQKRKEEIYQKRLQDIYLLRSKKRESIEKQLLLKDEIQKKNLEEIKNKKNKEIQERIKLTDRRTQQALEIIKLKNEQNNKKNESEFLQKNKLIEEKLNLQKNLEKKELHQRVIDSAIKREEIEENLRKKERILEKNRLRLLYEMEEKDKRLNVIKLQKINILEKQRKMNKNYEQNREKLFEKFNKLISQRNKKNKDEIVEELIGEKNKSNSNYKFANRSVDFIGRNNNNYYKEKDNVFLTNLSMNEIKGYKAKK